MATNSSYPMEKLTRVWSERRQKQVAGRVSYTVEDGDCRIYRLQQIEELDS